jgi:mycothiol maleylpyruvate isomerase-like protein
MRATLGDVSGLIGALDDGEWATASAAAGWTVKDVFAHFGDLLGILASAIAGTLDTDLGIERLNDAHVASKASWSPGQVTADLERQTTCLDKEDLCVAKLCAFREKDRNLVAALVRSSLVDRDTIHSRLASVDERYRPAAEVATS